MRPLPAARCCSAVLAFGLCAAPALAAEPPRSDGQWRGNAGAALSATSGNNTSASLLLNVDVARLTEADKISLGGNINHARSEVDGVDTTTANRINAFGQYDRNIGPRLFAFGRLALDRDEVIDLDLRTAVATGLGWKVVDTPALRFNVFGGVGHTVDRYGVEQTIDGLTRTRFSRSNLVLAEESTHEWSPTLNFKQRLEVLPGLSGDKVTLIKFTADVGVTINSSMRLSVGLVDTYASKPPVGREKNDLSLFTGLNVRFGAD